MFRGACVSQPHRLTLGECISAVCWHRCSLWRLSNVQICVCHISQERHIHLVCLFLEHHIFFDLTVFHFIHLLLCRVGFFSDLSNLSWVLLVYYRIMPMTIKRTRHQKSSRFNVRIICLFSWFTGTLGPRDHLIAVHNNSAFQIIALKFSIYFCHFNHFKINKWEELNLLQNFAQPNEQW